MKIFSKLNTLAALLVAGAAFTACSSDNDITNGNETPNPGTSAAGKEYNLTLGVSNDKISTKALDLGADLSITATWKPADNIYVYTSDWKAAFSGKLNPTATGNPATVKGTIKSTDQTGELAAGSKINMLFPRTTWDYTGQDGKITTLAQKYDYAIAEGTTITSINSNNIEETNPNPVFFTAQQAIVRFDFKNGTTPINVKEFEIRDGVGQMVESIDVSTQAETKRGYMSFDFGSGLSTAYLALRGLTSGTKLTMTATATDGTMYYKELELNQDLENGKYYAITFSTEVVDDEALTVEAIENNTDISIDLSGASSPVTIKLLNSDNTLAQVFTIPNGGLQVLMLSAGQKALFYGENDTYTLSYTEPVIEKDPVTGEIINISTSVPAGSCHIKPNKLCYLYNNIMSLTNGLDWASKVGTPAGETLREKATFAGLFEESLVKQHDTKPLVLPAKTLQPSCYQRLLYGTQFSKVPTDLLPSTTLANFCYSAMFAGTPLTESPNLPAETLVKGCYNYMFNSCSSLKKITCNAKTFPTDSDDPSVFNSCTANWTQGVPETTDGIFRMTNAGYSNANISEANWFATNPTQTEHNGIRKIDYMGNNSSVPFTIGTGGIPQNWTVTR